MMTNHASEQMFSLTFQQIDWKKFNKILKISSNSIIDLKDSEQIKNYVHQKKLFTFNN